MVIIHCSGRKCEWELCLQRGAVKAMSHGAEMKHTQNVINVFLELVLNEKKKENQRSIGKSSRIKVGSGSTHL